MKEDEDEFSQGTPQNKARASFRNSSSTPNRHSMSGPISMPSEETKQKPIKIVTEDIEEEYMAKASGMGQTKGISFISEEEEKDNKSLLINPS